MIPVIRAEHLKIERTVVTGGIVLRINIKVVRIDGLYRGIDRRVLRRRVNSRCHDHIFTGQSPRRGQINPVHTLSQAAYRNTGRTVKSVIADGSGGFRTGYNPGDQDLLEAAVASRSHQVSTVQYNPAKKVELSPYPIISITSRENLSVLFDIPSSKKYFPLGAVMVM